MSKNKSFEKGFEYGLKGFILGLVVQILFFVPDWGINKWLFTLVGVLIVICMGIATYKNVISKDNKFVVGFLIATIIMAIIGPSL